MRLRIMSLLRGVQRSAHGSAGAAASGRLHSPLSLRLRFFSTAYPTAAGTTTTTGQTTPLGPRADETRPAASARERDAHDLASPRPRAPWWSSRPYGGIVDAPGRENNPDAIELARFAVAEHNKRNAALEFVRLVKVRMQLVAGTMNYLTVEVTEVDGGGTSKLYEAKVLLRPWEKFKRRLEAFEPVADAA